jgi:hypothetical protein
MQRSVSSNRVMMSTRTHATMFFFRYVKSGVSRYLASPVSTTQILNSGFGLQMEDHHSQSSSTTMITSISLFRFH